MTARRTLTTLLAAALLGACAGTSPDVTAVRDPESVTAGAALYQANCAGCHGADLQGGRGENGGIAPSLIAKTGPDDVVLIESVKRGRGFGMPAFATLLEEGEIVSIIDYVRSLQAERVTNGE